MLLALQSLDPSSYGAEKYGVLGALVLVTGVLSAIVWKLFSQQSANTAARDALIMDFVSGHTQKHVLALGQLGDKIRDGDERIAFAMETQGRMLRGVLVANEALQRARQNKVPGQGSLTTAEIDQIVETSYRVTRRSETA